MTTADPLLQTYDDPEYLKSLKDTGIPAHQAEAIAAGVARVSADTNHYYGAMLQIWQGHQDQLDEIKTDIVEIKGRLDTVEADVVEIKGRLGVLEADVGEIKGRLGVLEAGVGTIMAVLQAQFPDAYAQATGDSD